MPFAASSAMLRRRGQLSGACLAASSTVVRQPREQYSASVGAKGECQQCGTNGWGGQARADEAIKLGLASAGSR